MNEKTKEILAMVYPYGLFGHYYVKFYDDFLKNYILRLSNEIRLILIVNSVEAKEVLISKFADSNLEIVLIPEAIDIWIRDWAPIPVKYSDGKIIYLKPEFTTGYYFSKKELGFIPKLQIACDKLIEYLGINVVSLPLKTDGGNFAFNGKDTIILTDRIIANNEKLSIDEIRNIYKKTLGISKVIFVPVEPEDVTGHTDGTLRFIDEKTLIIGRYLETSKKENDYIDKLTNDLKSQLTNDYKIIILINEIIEDENNKSKILSATGNHINFLKINKHILLPNYGIETDEIVYDTLISELTDYTITRIISKEIRRVSKYGGVLNCITWN